MISIRVYQYLFHYLYINLSYLRLLFSRNDNSGFHKFMLSNVYYIIFSGTILLLKVRKRKINARRVKREIWREGKVKVKQKKNVEILFRYVSFLLTTTGGFKGGATVITILRS